MGLPYREREENKENSKPKEVVKLVVPVDNTNDDDDDSDSEGPVLYKDDDDDSSNDTSRFFVSFIFTTLSSLCYTYLMFWRNFIHSPIGSVKLSF